MKKTFFILLTVLIITGCDNADRDDLLNGVDNNTVNDEQTVNDNPVAETADQNTETQDDATGNDTALTQDDTIMTDDEISTDNDNSAVDETIVPDDNTETGPVSMTVSVVTTTYGGQYAPKNVFAVWIEKADGTYVETLGAWAQKYKSKLQRWYSKSGNGSQGLADAVTGASRINHNDVPDLTWTIDDIANQPAVDGIYNVYFELNETNFSSKSTSAQIKMGSTPEVISVNNADNIKDIQISFSK